MVYRKYSDYLKDTYGEKIYKLPIGLPLSCPNRDGMCGVNGCAFCGEIGAGYENLPATMTVTEQINQNRAHISPKYKANRFIAYFQNFSNTYLPIDRMEAYVSSMTKGGSASVVYSARWLESPSNKWRRSDTRNIRQLSFARFIRYERMGAVMLTIIPSLRMSRYLIGGRESWESKSITQRLFYSRNWSYENN